MNSRLLDQIRGSFPGCTVDYDKQVTGGLLTIVWPGWEGMDSSARIAIAWTGLQTTIGPRSRPPKLILLTPQELADLNGEVQL